MSDYITIEQVKAEISKHLKQPSMSPYCQGAHDAIKACLRKLDRLEPPDAKLRRVREEVESMMAPHIQLGVGVASHPMVHKGHLLEIIDSHLTTSEVDEELEEAKRAWPVGRKFRNVWDKDAHLTILKVYRDTDHELRIKADSLNEYGQDWYIVNLYLLPSEPEVDEELEEVRKKFPVGGKFEREGVPTLLEVQDVHRNGFGNIRIVDHEDFAWMYTGKENFFALHEEPTEAEKLRQEADDLIERINNAVDKLGK